MPAHGLWLIVTRGPFAMKNKGNLNDSPGRFGITPLFCFEQNVDREGPQVTTISENVFLNDKPVWGGNESGGKATKA